MPNSQPSYESVVSLTRSAARDLLRMRMIQKRRTVIYELNSHIDSLKETVADFNKDIARADYQLSKLEDANPDKEQLTKDLNVQKEQFTKQIEYYNKQIANTEADIKAQEDGIAKITSGETKVSLDELNVLADEFLKEIVKDGVVKQAQA